MVDILPNKLLMLMRLSVLEDDDILKTTSHFKAAKVHLTLSSL
jgi:hypothetical protein